MPRLVELGTILERAKALCDKENSDHIEASVWRWFASQVYGSDIFSTVADTGGRYFEFVSTLTTTGAAYVSEPSDHLATIRLDYLPTATERRELVELMPGEVPSFTNGAAEASYFTHVDDRIYLYPVPPTGQTLELLYIPQPPDLSTYADDVCIDVVTPDGEACMVWGIAALGLAKAKQDATLALQKQEQHKERLQHWAVAKSFTRPKRLVLATDRLDDDLSQYGGRR